MKEAELVFNPAPVIGHLVSTVEIAKLLIDRDDRLSITVLLMKLPFHDSMLNTYTQSLAASIPTERIRFVNLPQDNSVSYPRTNFLTLFIQNQKPHVKETVTQIMTRSDSGHDSTLLGGFVLDMFCTCMIDVANEFGVPAYAFFTSGAACLGLMFHLQTLQDKHNMDVTELKGYNTELAIPSFANPLPDKVLPSVVFDKDGGSSAFLGYAKRLRETKGIMVNTFMELESHAVQSLSDDATTPKVYPVGPIVNLTGETHVGSGGTHQKIDIMTWLDDQPPSSVVFLCFGSMGSFDVDQVKEIAHGLEQSGQRFLWSLRQPPPTDKFALPTDYGNPEEVLPEGFLDRTAEIGKVIGWAPQVAVMAHPAIGVCVALWVELHLREPVVWSTNSRMANELGLAVEIKMDYRKSDSPAVVSAEEIKGGIRSVMEYDNEVRKKVKAVKEESRKTLMDGGSSYTWLGCFVKDVMDNMP
ncbi:hypothetical protein L1049_024534 [Liquidambar formosana]|uniref:Uncharacterized protein n=1 Tax=Liquidambar formosana TaxID=63359 RepID=A0AAP0RVY0_LIQFO